MRAVSPRDFEKEDLVEWIKAFDESNESAYKTIGVEDVKFEFNKRDTDELSVKLLSVNRNADLQKLPDLVQKKVDKVAIAARMLYHALCYESNTGKGHDVAAKRNLLYSAISDLLVPQNFASGIMTEKEENESKMWIRDNVLAMLLEPSSPPQSKLEELSPSSLGKSAKDLVWSAGSFATGLFGTRTSTDGSPSTQEEMHPLQQKVAEVPSLATSASTTPESKQTSFLFTRHSGLEALPPGDYHRHAHFTPEGTPELTASVKTSTSTSQSKQKQE